ncbi:tRNA (adenosine(37)-N6)-threonylcarbamoyltransferase complex ATPase subunit type 1 TsaE [Acidocella sp.]|uniref:tRNA (adenosine(37)-N6)-threonylcarbamoyltransferase complex ATPase subunit type 1 TsaE n=1 Tax=Acidocella sp. TaxID=50710 RepID=UPI003CFD3E2B
MRLHLNDESDTQRLGERLAAIARPGDVLLLEGPLGAGKSSLARAFIRARLGDARLNVPSPSFTLVQCYETPDGGRIWHYDLWRLDGAAAMEELGWDEALAGIALVEWPDRLGALAPRAAWRLTLSFAGTGRMVEIEGDLRGFDAT